MESGIVAFETSVATLPATAGEVFAYVKERMIASTRELAAEVEALELESRSIVVDSNAAAISAKDIINRKKDLADKIEAAVGPFKKKAHSLHKGVTAAETFLNAPLVALDLSLNGKLKTWIRAEEERKRKEFIDAQEVIRKENERKIQAARKKADALLAGISDLDGQAKALEASLDNPEITQEEADALRSKLNMVRAQITNKQIAIDAKAQEVQQLAKAPAPPPFQETKIEGMGAKKVYLTRVVNPMKLMQAVLDGLVPIGVVQWDDVQLRKLANNGGVASLTPQGGDPVIPGVEITDDIKISTRRG